MKNEEMKNTNTNDTAGRNTPTVVNLAIDYFWTSASGEIKSFTRYSTVEASKVDEINSRLVSGSSVHDYFSMEQFWEDESSIILVPVFATVSPSSNSAGYTVMCDVYNDNVEAVSYNYRSALISGVTDFTKEIFPKASFVQHFTLNSDTKNAKGLLRAFSNASMMSGITINKSSVLGKVGTSNTFDCSFEVGGSGMDLITACDHLMFARFILQETCNSNNCSVMMNANDSSTVNYIDNRFSKVTEEDSNDEVVDFCMINFQSFNYNSETEKGTVSKGWQLNRVGAGHIVDTRPSSGSNPYRACLNIMSNVCKKKSG